MTSIECIVHSDSNLKTYGPEGTIDEQSNADQDSSKKRKLNSKKATKKCMRVLEVGAGCGLLGLILNRLGHKERFHVFDPVD